MQRHLEFDAALLILALINASCAPLLFPQDRGLQAAGTFTPATVPSTGSAMAREPTATPGPFALDLTPLPTATNLPPLLLPTPPAIPLGSQNWDGLPTYPAESRPEYYFRLEFDPNAWALTTDQFGSPVLANRDLGGCILRPSSGRGLPLNSSVQHEIRTIGRTTFQISTALLGGEVRFVTYAGGDSYIYTAFEVSFVDSAEACQRAAEDVLASLRSVPLFEATPFSSR